MKGKFVVPSCYTHKIYTCIHPVNTSLVQFSHLHLGKYEQQQQDGHLLGYNFDYFSNSDGEKKHPLSFCPAPCRVEKGFCPSTAKASLVMLW